VPTPPTFRTLPEKLSQSVIRVFGSDKNEENGMIALTV